MANNPISCLSALGWRLTTAFLLLTVLLIGFTGALQAQPAPAPASSPPAINVVPSESRGKFIYTASSGTLEIARGEISLNQHKRSTRKFYTYNVSLRMRDFPFLEEPPINVEYEIYHFGDNGLRTLLQESVFEALKTGVHQFTLDLATMLVRHKGFYEACTTENSDCLKAKLDGIVQRVSGVPSGSGTDLSRIGLSSAQKVSIVEQINRIINDQEELIDDEYEQIANLFAERTLETISGFYEGPAATQLEASGMSSHVLRLKAAKALWIVGKAVFNILWQGVKIVTIEIPSIVKTVFKVSKEVVVGVNELIKLAHVWGDLSEKEDMFMIHFIALKGFERTRVLPDEQSLRRMASTLESLLEDTKKAYEDYEKTVMLVSKNGLDRKIDEIDRKMDLVIQSSGSGMDLPLVTSTESYKAITRMINREEYVALRQFKGNVQAAEDSLGNFSNTYKRDYLKEVNAKMTLLNSLSRAEERDLGRSSRGDKVKDWLKRKRRLIIAAWEKLEQGAELLETIQGDD